MKTIISKIKNLKYISLRYKYKTIFENGKFWLQVEKRDWYKFYLERKYEASYVFLLVHGFLFDNRK